MLDVRRLGLLRDLARLGTIAAVAQARSYTPSAVSQQLSALEREAGAPLLRRTGRRVSLTPAGAVLVEHAEEVFRSLERASAAVQQAGHDRLAGPLTIAAFPSAIRTLLPAAIVALARRHPGLELRVRECDPADAPEALRTRRCDLALVHGYDHVPDEPDPALTIRPLLTETMYLAGAADLGAARDRDWILASPGTLCHAMTVRACEAAGFVPRVRHHADDFATVLALVAAGQGVALVPELALAEAAPVGPAFQQLRTRRRTRMACRAGAESHPAVRAAMAAIRQAAKSYVDGRSKR